MDEETIGSGTGPDEQERGQSDSKAPAVSVSGRTGIHTLALVAAGVGGAVLGGSLLAGMALGFGDDHDTGNVAAGDAVTITTVPTEPTESESRTPSPTQSSTAQPHPSGRESAPAAPAAPNGDTGGSVGSSGGAQLPGQVPTEDPDAEGYGRHSYQNQGVTGQNGWTVRGQAPACGYIPGTGTRGGDTYLICSGQTLSVIASEVGVSIDELVRLNGIVDPNLIYAGAALRLPS